jgi:hypothetical protein
MKYTAIYIDSWLQGSHMVTNTHMKRLETKMDETVEQALERNQVADSMVYLFRGWPLLQGETINPRKAKSTYTTTLDQDINQVIDLATRAAINLNPEFGDHFESVLAKNAIDRVEDFLDEVIYHVKEHKEDP